MCLKGSMHSSGLWSAMMVNEHNLGVPQISSALNVRNIFPCREQRGLGVTCNNLIQISAGGAQCGMTGSQPNLPAILFVNEAKRAFINMYPLAHQIIKR